MIKEKIQKILTNMDDMFRRAVGPRNRGDYMKEAGVTNFRDWHFQLNATDIIDNKIPANVAGCAGLAKVFCKMAADEHIDCQIVCMALKTDWDKVRSGKANHMNGHQAIAVEIDGKLRMFNPSRPNLEFVDTNVMVGQTFNMWGYEFIITAIMTPQDFAKVDTYQKLHNIYASGDMNNPKFTIVPLSEMAVAQNMFGARH